MTITSRVLCAAAAAMALAGVPALAAYPDKPVRIVVPYAPGGASDTVARALGLRLGLMWKQQVIIENKPGAGGNIGTDMVAKSPADGYTLLLGSPAEISINPWLYAKLPYDAAKDLVPVSKVGSAPLVLVINANSPSNAKTLGELVTYMKAQKAGVNYASAGTGGPQHIAGELFKGMTGTQMTHVPYKGGAPAITDLLGGQVEMFFAGVPPSLPHINSGRLRALAVTTEKRSSLMPNVPTVAELGYPGFSIENWQAILVPTGTPQPLIEQLARDIATVAADKGFSDQVTAQGAVPAILGPTEFAVFLRAESAKYQKLVKDSGAKAD